MEVPTFKKFPGKVLLFGEYLVLLGEQALAIPVRNFSGELKLLSEFQENNIAPFIQYLGALPNIFLKQELIESIALDRLIFESDIPIGYGAGSSGALTAAVYHAFVEKHEGTLQEALASMEDFFHGSSSGLDPLVSYHGEATLPIDKKVFDHFFLIDTKIARTTGPLVQIFKEKARQYSFEALANANREAIKACETSNIKALREAMHQISKEQFEHFQEMIPLDFKKIWEGTLIDSNLSLKLCGAGGGGFLLIFASDAEKAGIWAKNQGLSLIKIEL